MIYWRGNPADTVLPCKLSEGVTGALRPEATLTTPTHYGLLCLDSPMAWSCDVPLWLWLDSALDEAVAMSYTTVGNLRNNTHTRHPVNSQKNL